MIYGLAGASGTGKSTLGKHVGDALSIPFVPTSVTDMARKAGFDAIGSLNLSDRLRLQESLLDQFQDLLNKTRGPVIYDRTPLDLVGYLVGEIDMHSRESLSLDQLARIDAYVTECQQLTARYFDHVFVTGILPFYDEAATRPAFNPAYQRHVQLLILGSVLDCDYPMAVTILTMPELHERVEMVTDVITHRLDKIESEKVARKLH